MFFLHCTTYPAEMQKASNFFEAPGKSDIWIDQGLALSTFHGLDGKG